MPDNEKGELIKKTELKTEKVETQPSKKIVVVKKLKKVIIKKHSQKNEKEEKKEENENQQIPQTTLIKTENQPIIRQQTVNQTNQPPREPKKIILNKNRTFTPNQGQRPFIPRPFLQNRGSGGGSPRSFQPRGGKPGPATAPIAPIDKEISRKKLNKKNYTHGNKKYQQEEQEIQKAFAKKKKEKDMLLAIPTQIDIIDVVSISDLAKKDESQSK